MIDKRWSFRIKSNPTIRHLFDPFDLILECLWWVKDDQIRSRLGLDLRHGSLPFDQIFVKIEPKDLEKVSKNLIMKYLK